MTMTLPTEPSTIVRVAAVQAEPEWLDLDASVQKTCSLIADAAVGGARLVAFPECFVPGYPVWIWTRPVDAAMTTRYIKNSLKVDSSQMNTIRGTAKKYGIDVVLGFSENEGDSLYMAQCAISGTDGEIKMQRRKLKPTHVERTVFGDASGNSLLNVTKMAYGHVGALQCWEHIQPLLKYHTFVQREQIHVAAWPSLMSYDPAGPIWGMSREGCIGQSQQYALEGGCFVLHTTATISAKGIELLGTRSGPQFNVPGGGCAAIFGPDGSCISKYLPEDEEGLVFADLDMDSILAARAFVDVCGHYSRPDMLWLGVDTRQKAHARDVGIYPHESPEGVQD